MSRKAFFVGLCVLCASFQAACGRKGPPLAPIVYLPRPVPDLAAKRVEDEVVLRFTVPTLNTDGSGPADLRRIEVYAHTGPLPATTDFLKYGTLVSSIDIEPPPEPKEEREAGEAGAEDAAPEQLTLTVEAREGRERLTPQGAVISVREALTEKHLEIGPMPPARPAPPAPPNAPVVERLETPETVNFELPPMRFYTVVGVSRSRGRRGPYAGPLRVPLAQPLNPPDQVDVSYTESSIALAWPRQPEDTPLPVAPVPAPSVADPKASVATPPPNGDRPPAVTPAAGVAAPAIETPPVPPVAATPPVSVVISQETEGTFEIYADVETEGTMDVAPPAPPPTPVSAKAAAAARAAAAAAKAAATPAPRFGYNVYDASEKPAEPGDAAASVDGPPAALAPVMPLNTALLTAPTFSDPRVEFGVERCYVIRRVEMSSGVPIESAPSQPVCVTPVDTFPPAAPKNLQAISGGAGVSLLWEANTESDLGGYLVLRGEAPGDKLSPLTEAPIADTSFSDTTVRRGHTYVYEVIAVDRQTPANQSPPSNRVEETIR